MRDVEVETIAARVLGDHLSALGLDHIEVGVERDDPDEPQLVVEAVMKPGIAAVGGRLISIIHGELHQVLRAAGEQRFPYLRVRYQEDEPTVGMEPFTQ